MRQGSRRVFDFAFVLAAATDCVSLRPRVSEPLRGKPVWIGIGGMLVWSLPKVFHTCGKNCGKSTSSAAVRGLDAPFSWHSRNSRSQAIVDKTFNADLISRRPEPR
jgi:hypothetical protein